MSMREFKEKNTNELVLERDKLRKEYQDIKFKKVIGAIENPLKIRTIRRNISRINTVLHMSEIKKVKKEIENME